MIHLTDLENQKQSKLKMSRRKQIMKIEGITEKIKTIQKINESKTQF